MIIIVKETNRMKQISKIMLTTFVSLLVSVPLFGQAQGIATAQLFTTPPPPVQNVSYAITGTAGSTNYYYYVVAVYPIGMVQPLGGVWVSNAPDALSGSNYVTITWSAPSSSVTGYWVIRSTSSTFPGSGTNAVNTTVISSSTFTQTDQSTSTLHSFTMSGVGTSVINIAVNNKDFSKPAVLITDASGNVLGQWITKVSPQYVVSGNLTISQVNAGTIIVPAVPGAAYVLTSVMLQAIGGAVATCTAIQVDDTAGTPIVGVSVPQASLTQNTFISETAAGNTLTTFAWQGALTSGQGIQILKTGSSCATATSINYKVGYQINY